MKIKLDKEWITDSVTSVTWSGTDTQCSRTLEFSLLHNPHDPKFQSVTVKLGAIVRLYEKDKQLFLGEVTTIERTGEKGTITVRAMDFLNHLLKSKTSRTFRNTTAEKITESICKEIGIKTGALEQTKINIAKYYPREEVFYNIILGAYRKAAKQTKRKYMLTMDGTKLTVVEKGTDSKVLLKQNETILASSYSKTLDSMINQIVIFDEKGKQVGVVKNDNWVKKYGIYQEAYTKEKETNAKTAAESLLKGIEQSASIEAIGDIRAISGKSIRIRDKGSGLTGKFWITSDSHTWQNGTYKMSLELTFKNIMEAVSVNTEEQKKGSSSSTSKSDNDKINKLIDLAKSFQGKVTYIFGASSPQNGKSDCSGYTQYVYQKAAGINIGRTTNEQVKKGKQVNKADLQVGDLVLFKNTYNSGYAFGVSHVGIYLGKNQFIHCSSGAKTVTISNLSSSYYTEHWCMGRRIIT